MNNIVKFWTEAPEGMPETVGPKVATLTQETLRKIYNVLGLPIDLAAIGLTATRNILDTTGRALLLATAWPLYKVGNLFGQAADVVVNTRDKAFDLLSLKGLGHADHGGHAEPAPTH